MTVKGIKTGTNDTTDAGGPLTKGQQTVATAVLGLSLAIVGALATLSYTSASKEFLQGVKFILGLTCFSTGVAIHLLALRKIFRKDENQETSH